MTDEITIKKFSYLSRFGLRAGRPNENFLNADLFVSAFLGPCEAIRSNEGLFVFEFSRFYPADFARGRDFGQGLDGFMNRLPRGCPYGVEIRNRSFLNPEYFGTLAKHGVTHVLNSLDAMLPVDDQLALQGSLTGTECAAARLLLQAGCRNEEAVKLFSPCDRLKDPEPASRPAVTKLIR